MKSTTFWLLAILGFLAGFFTLGFGISIGFLVGAILTGPIRAGLGAKLITFFWPVELVAALLLFVVTGGSIALGFLAGTVVYWVWGP